MSTYFEVTLFSWHFLYIVCYGKDYPPVHSLCFMTFQFPFNFCDSEFDVRFWLFSRLGVCRIFIILKVFWNIPLLYVFYTRFSCSILKIVMISLKIYLIYFNSKSNIKINIRYLVYGRNQRCVNSFVIKCSIKLKKGKPSGNKAWMNT